MRVGARTGAGREAAAVEVLIGVRRDPKCYAKATDPAITGANAAL